jgi:NAD(P)-dependent dehydrogenase (short-subunit alcohol dehydrogenase family)
LAKQNQSPGIHFPIVRIVSKPPFTKPLSCPFNCTRSSNKVAPPSTSKEALNTMSQDPGQKYLNNGLNFTPTQHHDTYPSISPLKVDLSGKHVLITGASRGIGKGIALSYALAGCSKIAICARSPLSSVSSEIKKAARDAGRPEPTVLAVHLDVTSQSSVSSAVQTVSTAFDHRLDILINNAGTLSTFGGITDTHPDEWWRDFETNVKGTYLVTRALIPLLLPSPLRIILNITSIAALYMPALGSAYGTSKLAILRFTEYVHQDHGPGKDGIVCLAVHPGTMETELARGMPEEYVQWFIDTERLAGDVCVWLGRERREWLGGRYVSVIWDGGELEGRREDVVGGDLLRVRMGVNLF